MMEILTEKGTDIVRSSFRDPSGFVFRKNGILYRQVNNSYKENYDQLLISGLYSRLVSQNLLVQHSEIELTNASAPNNCYKIIQPTVIPFVSYPYEWCFSQLKSAALLTLKLQKTALEYGMVIKDASAYNIQFNNGKPIMIDTLSFEKYLEGQPWVAYRQFCQHFLGPLALMSKTDPGLGRLFRLYPDGIPLALASKLLPATSWFNTGLLLHIHLHFRSQNHFQEKDVNMASARMNLRQMNALIENLTDIVKKMDYKPEVSQWADYSEKNSYTEKDFSEKKEIVGRFVNIVKPEIVWDLGSNDGTFSRIAAKKAKLVISMDIDSPAVEKNLRETEAENYSNILPLLMDITNPSPGIGWGNREFDSITDRGPADLIMVLALAHHLAISHNLSFKNIVECLGGMGRYLIIEFAPKHDIMVKKLMKKREHIFENYSQANFESAFEKCFDVEEKIELSDRGRVIYLMKNKKSL